MGSRMHNHTSADPAHRRAAVVTVSDRCSAGVREDLSGSRAEELLRAAGWEVSRALVADDVAAIRTAVQQAVGQADLVVTTGGTGVGPRDVTPEAVGALLDRELPGLAEGIRRAGCAAVPTAMLSRGRAGMVGGALIVNLAGSVGAVEDGIPVILSVADHALEQARGGDHR